MWYFILALLFGNPSNTNTNNDNITLKTQSVPPKGNGGDKGVVRPGK